MDATSPDPRRDERARDDVTHHDTTTHDTRHTEPVRGDGVTHTRVYDEEAARHRFGGANVGAAFFGWLVAVGMTALLTGIAGRRRHRRRLLQQRSRRPTPSAPPGRSRWSPRSCCWPSC